MMYPFTDRLATGVGSRLGRYLPLLTAFASGAFAVLGFAPFSLFPLAVVAVAALYETLWRCSPRAGFWRGYAFGLGLLGFGISWIRISLNEFGNLDGWIADLMMLIFVAGMALYYGLAGWLTRRLDLGPPWSGPLLLFPGIYVIFEWLRGWLLTGFPWLDLGYTQIDGPLAGFGPVAGVYGVSLLVAVSGGLLWGLVRWTGRGRIGAGAGLVVLWLTGAGLQQIDWTSPAGLPFTASVLQANIPQAVKWNPEAKLGIMESYVDLTLEHLGSDLILWPETAIPEFLHEVRAVMIDPLAQRARESGAEIVMGIPVLDQDTGRYYNGLVSLGSQNDFYAKRHLVPFGEYLPFKKWLGPLVDLFEVPMSDFSAGQEARPLLKVGDYSAGASICYEDAFPEEVVQALPEAAYLISVSNDAWFGDSLAPHQHLEIARMRALEAGRYLVRATNTGISAIVDHRGRVLGTVPSFVRGAYTDEVEPRSGATPYARVRNWLAIGLAFAFAATAVLLGRWRRR